MGKDDVFGCGSFAGDVRENSNSTRDFNLSNLKCEFFTAGNTDVGVNCSNSRLAFKMEVFDQDFCICSSCRSLPNTLNMKSSLPDCKISAPGRNEKVSVMPEIKYAVKECDRAQTIFGAEEIEVSPIHSFAIDDGSIASDDVPLLLGDSYESENEQSDHCHIIKKVTTEISAARRKLIISSLLCLIFMIAEIVGGYLSNSLAILTDAAHLLSDLTSFLISLFAIYVGQKAPTRRMSFGYYRAEVIGAVVSVLLIWVLTGILVYMAVDRVRFPDYEIDADIMLIISGVGVAVNIVMGLVLHGSHGSHGHSHGSPSSPSQHEGNSGSHATQNINVRAAFVHVIGDLVQSVGVLVAAIIIRYKPEYKLADPICTFIFSVLVMFTTYSIMRDAVYVLMEGFPKNLNYGDIKDSLSNLNGVKSVHNLHVWSLTIDKNSLSVHLAVDPEADTNTVLRDAQTLVRRTYNIHHAAIQIEKYESSYMADCKACQGPIV